MLHKIIKMCANTFLIKIFIYSFNKNMPYLIILSLEFELHIIIAIKTRYSFELIQINIKRSAYNKRLLVNPLGIK